MTYNNPEIIETMLRNKGVYPGDPQMARIYVFNGINGREVYAAFAHPMHDDMHDSPWVRGERLLFDRTGGLTEAGLEWLEKR